MQQTLSIAYSRQSFEELPHEQQQVAQAAIDAMQGAHAPYSNFQVGSAVLLADGSTVTGNNQENAAYPSGLCAERVALFAAKSQTKQAVRIVAIAAQNDQGKSADSFSCGSCRQVMMEYASLQDEKITVIMRDHEGQFIVLEDARQLLPFSFGADTLK